MRAVLVAPALAVAVLALSGCGILEQFLPSQTESRFRDFAAFQADAAAEFIALDWVPSDSTLLATKVSDRHPGKMLKFQSEAGVTAEGCVPGLLAGQAPFETVWWPSEEPLTGLVCNDTWRVFGQDGAWYAWTD